MYGYHRSSCNSRVTRVKSRECSSTMSWRVFATARLTCPMRESSCHAHHYHRHNTHTHTHTHTVMNLGVVLQAQIFLLLQQLILHHTMYAPYYLYIMTCGDHLNHTQSSIKHPHECAQDLEVLCEQSFFVSLLI